jgi:DsbC/DsbD-like thiol-disulfide interchange protein
MLPAATQRLAIAAFALVCLSETLAAAQDASAWDKELHAAARLIAGSIIESDDTTLLRAGIEIRLDPGWHTYWRDPGDSGVPPTFDFAGSENVKSVTVLWPAPARFPDGAGGHFIGYKGNVIFPLRIVPKEAATGSLIHLKLAYAVCEKLCIPADANLKLALPGMSSANERVLIAAETRVPRSVPLGAGNSLAIRSAHREGSGGHDRVVVDVAAPDGVPVDLFAEGPTPDWSLPLPELIGSGSGTRRFAFDLEGLPPGARADGATLTFTAVLPDDAIEVVTQIE